MSYATFSKILRLRKCQHQTLAGLMLAVVFTANTTAASLPEGSGVTLPGTATSAATATATATATARSEQVVKDGIALQMDISQSMQEGAEARFTLNLRDAATLNPIRNARPIAWVDGPIKGEEDGDQACKRKVAAFIGGDLLRSPVLSLNAYYVLALNEDNSISVINPQTGFGGSKLLTMVILHGVGQDWLLTPEQTLWVSQPQAGEVALVDTRSWQVKKNVSLKGHPGQMVLLPGAQQVWVVTDEGVAVLAAASGQLIATIPTGQGRHAIAFSDDGKNAFVSNTDDNSISLINVSSLQKTADVTSGIRPVSMAWSTKAQLLYVAHEGDGQLLAFDVAGRQVASIKSLPGISTIRFAPDGRYGFILNPQKNKLELLDAATNQIVQDADVNDGPDQVTFSERMAYIRRRHSEIMQLVPLDAIGHAGQPLAMASLGSGQKSFDMGRSASLADSMVMTPNGAAALLANPADRTIYYYQEGMAAPAGSFRNYGHEPRAVLVLDHSLQERQPGQYQASARLPSAGNYQLVFYLDSPKMLHCLPLTVQADPAKVKQVRYAVSYNGVTPALGQGISQKLQFSVRDAANGQVMHGIKDLQILLLHTATNEQLQVEAHELEEGAYGITFLPPHSGYYYVFFQAASLGMNWNQAARLVLTAK